MVSAGGSNPMIDNASMLLPLPDLPTMPSTSPAATVKRDVIQDAGP